MSYETGESRSAIDVWSRMMAIGSLVLAGATLYRSYLQTQQDPTTFSTLKADVLNEVKENVGKQLDDFQIKLTTRQTDGLESLRTDLVSRMNEVMKPALDATKDPPAVPERIADTDSGSGAKGSPPSPIRIPTDSAGNNDLDLMAGESGKQKSALTEESADPNSMKIPANEEIAAGLVSTYVAKRPGMTASRPSLSLRNPGGREASIMVFEFIPQEVIEGVPEEIYESALPTAEPDTEVVTFRDVDNLSQTMDTEGKGRMQGKYRHRFDKSIDIAGGAERQMVLAIEDSEHVKYGLKGRLIITFNVDEQATIDNVVIPFIKAN